jgi:hypothetical protein
MIFDHNRDGITIWNNMAQLYNHMKTKRHLIESQWEVMVQSAMEDFSLTSSFWQIF